MLIDTHCHVNILAKNRDHGIYTFDVPLTKDNFVHAAEIIDQAKKHGVTTLINVGTSIIESKNCIELAQRFENNFTVVGIHPNDITDTIKDDLVTLKKLITEHPVVGVGECGLDFHYPDYNKQKQIDVFRAHIELALEYNKALVVHSRDAYEETLMVLEEYKDDITRGVMHCFSYDMAFAQTVLPWNMVLGIGGTITYPRNNELREVVQNTPLEKIVLETDAPFLPPQIIRGKRNHPQYIVAIAEYIAKLKKVPFKTVAEITTTAARRLFDLQDK